MTTQAEGEQAPHDDAPAAQITANLPPQVDKIQWYHQDGSACTDWAHCDTYEHWSASNLRSMLGIEPLEERVAPQFIEFFGFHEDGSSCTYRDSTRCPVHMHYSEYGLSQLGIKPNKQQAFNHEGPADFANVQISVATRPELCVECHHRYFDHSSSAVGGGCRITSCDCDRYYDPEPESGNLTREQAEQVLRDGNVGELIDGRVDVYGDPVKVFTRHAQVWSGILGTEVQPWQVALCMMGYKLVRTSVTPDYSDNSDDIDGYKDIFTSLIGEDMVHARDTATYLAGGGQGART